MSFCAIICEYNPLHYGHIYHMQKTCQTLRDIDGIICIMSGNFVQRGEPAVADKFTRAKWAVEAGADIVIELPAVFAVSPAKNFAYGAVKLASAIKSVKYLSFGSEYGDIQKVTELSENLKTADISAALKKGISYASAFAERQDLYKSNNILGAEYISAIKEFNSGITPFTVKRQGNDYNSTSKSGNYISAQSIRQMLECQNFEQIKCHVPLYVYEQLKNYSGINDRLFDMVIYKLLFLGAKNIEKYAYVTEGLENRIYNAAQKNLCYNRLIKNIVTKRYPLSKINRVLINILLDITKTKLNSAKSKRPYARVLALKKGRKDILSEISRYIKIIARADDYKNTRDSILNIDVFSTQIYSKLSGIDLNDINYKLDI